VLRADRLGTLGTLAAGLAHEINNPLVSIHTFLSLAPEKRSEDDPAFWHEYHELASGELERIRGLVSTMSRLARGGTDPTAVTRTQFSLDEVCREIVGLVGREVTAGGVDLQLEVRGDAPKIVGVREHIHQVLLNLVLNAVQATPAEGRVRLSVRADRDAPSEQVEVVVSDTGAGIPDEYLERIFDPFFTTKDPDEGTGLGLMISHQIVADHGGTIAVQSRPGEGATFTLKLPAGGLQASGA
jgi:signal transduction histidine kinase